VATKSTTDAALAAAIVADPANFYFNLHTTTYRWGAPGVTRLTHASDLPSEARTIWGLSRGTL
jgi:hypothetical protein